MAFHNMGLLQRLRLMFQLLRGTHEAAPEVEATTSSTIDLVFEAPPAYEIDGEWNRAVSERVRVECVPGALTVLVPPAA
jgi:diacylglycerol kinase family enzyme